MQEFKKLLVWRRAHAFALRVHDAVEKFPRNRFGQLKSQLTRAADSIAANIVEVCGSTSQREFARFLAIADRGTPKPATPRPEGKTAGQQKIDDLDVCVRYTRALLQRL